MTTTDRRSDRAVADALVVPTDVRVATRHRRPLLPQPAGHDRHGRWRSSSPPSRSSACRSRVVSKGIGVVIRRLPHQRHPDHRVGDELQATAPTGKYGGDVQRQAAPATIQPGMGPAIVGTLIVTGLAALIAIPLGILAADLPQRVRQARPPGPVHPVHDRRHDRRAVGGDGHLHLHVLGRELRPGTLGARRRARPGLPDAADRRAIDARRCCGSCPTRCARRSAALGARTWKTTLAGRAARPPCPASCQRRRCWPWPGPPARPRRCCSPSAPPTTVRAGHHRHRPEHDALVPDLQPDHQRREAVARRWRGARRSP